MPGKDELGGELPAALKELLRHYHDMDQTPASVAGLHCYRALRRQCHSEAEARRALVDAGLDSLASRDLRLADLLRDRFKEGLKAEYVANRLGVAPATLFEWQNSALDKFARGLLQREDEERRLHADRLRQAIPLAAAAEPVGIAGRTQTLAALLAAPAAPWLIAITGLGGIGKSTVAAAASAATVQAGLWDAVAWVTARTSHLEGGWSAEEPVLSAETLLEQLCDQLLPDQPKPASFSDGRALALLREHCRQRRCLIVADNLESVAAVRRLLPTLRQLIQPTKVLIGSREKLHMEPDVADFPVPELDEADALALLRACAGGRLAGEAASDADLHEVYAVVGGNPHALRVVGGQLLIFGLDVVLADLRTMRSRRVEQLYAHIYRRAWEGLNAAERHLLLAMAAVDAGGETLDYIMRLADLDDRLVLDGIETLVVRNLVEQRAQNRTVRYTIHNLTRTFLYQQIVDWGAAAGG